VHILGLDPDLMEDDIPSPFQGPQDMLEGLMARLPEALKPTKLQLEVPHHPEVDGFPYRELRDNFIRAGESFDTEEFCMDILYGVEASEEDVGDGGEQGRGRGGGQGQGQCEGMSKVAGISNGRTGLIVWSDPWLTGSWEVEEGFARKYSWLLRGCRDICESTNFWRRSRGEPPLRFEEVND